MGLRKVGGGAKEVEITKGVQRCGLHAATPLEEVRQGRWKVGWLSCAWGGRALYTFESGDGGAMPDSAALSRSWFRPLDTRRQLSIRRQVWIHGSRAISLAPQ